MRIGCHHHRMTSPSTGLTPGFVCGQLLLLCKSVWSCLFQQDFISLGLRTCTFVPVLHTHASLKPNVCARIFEFFSQCTHAKIKLSIVVLYRYHDNSGTNLVLDAKTQHMSFRAATIHRIFFLCCITIQTICSLKELYAIITSNKSINFVETCAAHFSICRTTIPLTPFSNYHLQFTTSCASQFSLPSGFHP